MKILSIAVVLLLVAKEATAQGVVGVALDAETDAPIAGALITVSDSSKKTRTRVLTDARGRFVASLQPGSYGISAEVIGYHPEAARIKVITGPYAAVQLRLRPAAIELAEIVVEKKRQCRSANDPNTQDVWSFARTALGSVSATATRRYTYRSYEVDLDLALRPVREPRMHIRSELGQNVFHAASADSLLHDGFIQERLEGNYFYGPGVDLLLSEEFVDTHCFNISRSKTRRGMIGLDFWPNGRGPEHDIRGTMWLDERSGLLRLVAYTFTGRQGQIRDERSREIPQKYAAGEITFVDKGAGLRVDKWHIRVPRYAYTMSGGRRSPALVGATEGGGEILAEESLKGNREHARGAVAGLVFDSITNRPIANAQVFLSGTPYSTTSDSLGAFHINDVPVGTHYLAFYHPSLAAYAPFSALTRIHIDSAATRTVHAAVPSAATLIARNCAPATLNRNRDLLGLPSERVAVVTGRITNEGVAIVGARVQVSWSPRVASSLALNQHVSGIWADTDSRGYYAVCGVPAGIDLLVSVTSGGEVIARTPLRGPSGRALRLDIALKN